MEFPKHQTGPHESFESPAELLALGVLKIVDQTDANIAVEVHHEAHGMVGATDAEKEQTEKEFVDEGRNELMALLKDSPALSKVIELYDSYSKNELSREDVETKIKDIIVHPTTVV